MPGIFLHATKDRLVSVKQSREMYELYPGDKYLLELGGGHNSVRPLLVLNRVGEILQDILESPQPPQETIEDGMKTVRAVPPSFRTNPLSKDS